MARPGRSARPAHRCRTHRAALHLAVAGAASLAAMMPARADPADTLGGLWTALSACARRARVPPETAGSEVTVLFALRRDGSLQGRPRITYARLAGDAGARRAFLAATLAAIAGCFPIPVTDGLGGAVAGRPIRFRVTSGSRDA